MQSLKDIIAQEAASWFVKNSAGLRTVEERAEFAAWLRGSPLHIEEYLRTAVAARDMRLAAQLEQDGVEEILRAAEDGDDGSVITFPALERRRSTAPRTPVTRPLLAALAASLLLLFVTGGIWLERDGQRFGLPKTYSTAHGEQRSWLLPDGSSVSLDSDTSLVVNYSGQERLVRVEKGRALFQVAHEPARRFRVASGDAGVIAIGTRFVVGRSSASTRVTVLEGKVAVFSGAAPQLAAGVALPARTMALEAGEQSRIDDHSAPARPATVNVQRAAAWVQHEIVFDQQPLAQVAEEFNRYSDTPIVISDQRLAEIPVSGVFDAYDMDSFVAFIARLDHVSVERRVDVTLVSAQAR